MKQKKVMPLWTFFTAMIILTMSYSCSKNTFKNEVIEKQPVLVSSKAEQDSIIKKYLKNGAWTKGLYSREWQEEIDKGLAKDSTIAYLWQQKSMPLYKQGKYELGRKYIDKAVKYNRREWQEYRAFMTCIFTKNYQDAIADFEDCKQRFGNSYVMDHSYNFYIAISKLQLNEFAEAEKLLEAEVAAQLEAQSEEWVHYLDLFYLGISQYEQAKYGQAITTFDRALKLYPQFSEVLYYKANCVGRLGDREKAGELIQAAKSFAAQGYSINEDNSIYERYPYQVRW